MDGGGNTVELVVPIVIFEPVPVVENTSGNETDPNNRDNSAIPRKEINEGLVTSFWIIFGIMVIIVIIYDVTVNIKGLHVEKEMDYYIQKRGTGGKKTKRKEGRKKS